MGKQTIIPKPPVLLVIDDEPSVLHAFGWVFRKPAVNLLTAKSALAGIDQIRQHRPDVVILDVNLPDLSGLEAFGRIRQFDTKTPVIFITGHGTTDTAIEATKLGALDYLFKPLDLTKLRQVVNGAFEVSRRMRVRAVMAGEDLSPNELSDVLVGRCEAMNEVYRLIGRVATEDVPVLILGESGTGKELVARAIWQHSHRSTAPFLAVNCAAIPEALLASELFGHEQGAFTGADRLRIGKFEQCRGGTLFLDEIGDMKPESQAKILRVLQEKEFERVGGNQTIQTDIRLITATNQKLDDLLPNAEFRSDLYYRLSVFSIKLPPLRDRGDDLHLLIEHLLRRFKHELARDIPQIVPETLAVLRRYPWPGNIRQLQNVLKQAILQTSGPDLTPEFLPTDMLTSGWSVTDSGLGDTNLASSTTDLTAWDRSISQQLGPGADTQDLYALMMAPVERHLLTRVLRHTRANQLRAAKILGITRSTLRTKIRTLGIDIEDIRWPNDDQP